MPPVVTDPPVVAWDPVVLVGSNVVEVPRVLVEAVPVTEN